jgi:hypothetical protein
VEIERVPSRAGQILYLVKRANPHLQANYAWRLNEFKVF